MKKNFIIPSLLLTGIVLFLTFCKKGDTGAAGSNGADGKTIISGNGLPPSGVGKIGDFFLDTIGKVLWGPKNSVSWGAGLALVGPQGVAGNTVLSGTVAPSAAVGKDGDFYINVATNTIYGPKTAAGWGGATSLVGATGATGATGAAGASGTPAQVIYSPWVTSPFNSRDTTIDGTCLRVRHLGAPALTSAILNSGVMITYFRIGSIGPYALPYISDAGGATNQINCIYNVGKIFVYRHTYNTCRFTSATPEAYPGQPLLVSLPQSLEYRYLFIPGLVPVTGKVSGQNVDLSNVSLPGHAQPINFTKLSYEGACQLLGIPQ